MINCNCAFCEESRPAIKANHSGQSIAGMLDLTRATGMRNANAKPATATSTQVGGDHYSKLKIQPVEYIHANNIPFIEGSVIKYVTRWRDKGGVKDLEKANHFIELLIELEGLK